MLGARGGAIPPRDSPSAALGQLHRAASSGAGLRPAAAPTDAPNDNGRICTVVALVQSIGKGGEATLAGALRGALSRNRPFQQLVSLTVLGIGKADVLPNGVEGHTVPLAFAGRFKGSRRYAEDHLR